MVYYDSIVFLCFGCSTAEALGVNYGRMEGNIPQLSEVVKFLHNTIIDKVKLFYADPSVL